MATSDELIALFKWGAAGDIEKFREVARTVIANEKAKKHMLLASMLERALRDNKARPVFVNENLNGLLTMEAAKTLDELFLSEENREICADLLAEYKNAERLEQNGLAPRNRILLVGPPGNGKTSLAAAFGKELDLPVYLVCQEKMFGQYLGETASRLSKIFETVAGKECVLFFDEFEALGKERGDPHEVGEIKRVVSSLLTQIDRLSNKVVVFAATNHPELLDRAVWRRFQARLDLDMPDMDMIMNYFDKYDLRLPSGMTDVLRGKCFGELEEIMFDIRRKQIIYPDRKLEDIIENKWKKLTHK